MSPRRLRNAVAAVIAVALAALGAGCSSNADEAGTSGAGSAAETPSEVKLVYFPNITHAPAIVGIDHDGIQRRPSRDRGAVVWRHRCHVYRA